MLLMWTVRISRRGLERIMKTLSNHATKFRPRPKPMGRRCIAVARNVYLTTLVPQTPSRCIPPSCSTSLAVTPPSLAFAERSKPRIICSSWHMHAPFLPFEAYPVFFYLVYLRLSMPIHLLRDIFTPIGLSNPYPFRHGQVLQHTNK
jgi:hypothetical protein